MKNQRFSKLITCLATLFLVLALAPAASRGASEEGKASLSVTVRNSWGEVPGATVLVVDEVHGTRWRASSDDAGAAVFSLPPGTYRLRVDLDSFMPYEETAVVLASGQEKSVEALLVLTRFSSAITVTTANRREQLLLDVAEPTTLLDEAQILDTGGFTAKDVLGEQAGAGVVVNNGGGRGHVSINGVANSGVLVLIDGRRYLGRNGIGDLNLEDLDLANAERIEIVKGAGSALYGTDALGGVINIITRKSTDPGTFSKLELAAGSHSDFRAAATLDHRSDDYGFNLIAAYRTSDGFDLEAEDPQTLGEPKSEWWNFQGSTDFQISEKTLGQVFAYYSQRDVEENFFTGATQLGEEVFDQQLDLTRYTLSPDFDFLLTPSTDLNLRLTHGKYEREETDVFAEETVVLQPWKEWNTEAKLTLRQSWRAFGQEQLLQGGYEFRHQKMDRANLRVPGAEVSEVDRDLNVGWLQQVLAFTDKLSLIAGVRYDNDSEYGSETSPKLSALYAPSDSTRLRTSWGKGFRAPRFGELFIEIPFFFVGNPDLEPETSETLTLGFSYFSPKFQASIDYYDTELDNAIVFDLGDFIPPFTYANIRGISTREGFNTELAFMLPGGFTPSLAYSYIEARDSDGEEIGGFATHSGFIKLLWQSSRLGLRANLRGEYHGEETPGSFDGSYTPEYSLWHFQVSKTFVVKSRELRAWARVDNLFDKTDIFRRDADGDPIPGSLQVWEDSRNFHVGLSVELGRAR